MSVCAIVVAAGRSDRFGGDTPKVLVALRGRPLLAWTLDAFDRTPEVSHVVLVASEAVETAWLAAGSPGRKVAACVRGGSTRQESVGCGIAALPPGTEIVLVHDGARPHVTPALVAAVAQAARRSGAALPVLAVVDTVKRLGSSPAGGPRLVLDTVPRETIGLAQTPQGFRLPVLLAARRYAEDAAVDATDDAALVEAAGGAGKLPPDVRVEAVPGEVANVKVTRREDLPRAPETRVGLGHDIHPLSKSRDFFLGGVDIQRGVPASERLGPTGHSDGDALTHALCDAILGAAGLEDIGHHFPDTDATNEGRSSLDFLAHVVALAAERGWSVRNASLVVHLERPRVGPHAFDIRTTLASVLGIAHDAVGLSAKRGEGLGPVGLGQAVASDAVVLLERLP